MNTLQMKYFLEVVNNGNFSKTARDNYVSQPDISKHMRNLEKEMGLTFFDRTGKHVKLTEAGEIFYNLFSEFFQSIEVAKRMSLRRENLLSGKLSIGVLAGGKLPKSMFNALQSIKSDYPDIEITVRSHNFEELVHSLEAGAIDILFHFKDFFSFKNNLEIFDIMTVPKYLIYSRHLVLSQDQPFCGPLSPAEFKNQTFLAIAEDNSQFVKALQIKYCKCYGFTPVIKTAPNRESVLLGVENCEGVSIIDNLFQVEEYHDINFVEMQPPHIMAMAVLKENTSPLVRFVVNHLLLFSYEKHD